LRKILNHLFLVASELRGVYTKEDGRFAQNTSVAEMEEDWATLPANDPLVRDAHCHEAVMWYVHHLSEEDRHEATALFKLPLLPVTDNEGARSNSNRAEQFYQTKVTCQDCHVGGMGSYDDDPKPPANKTDRSRRCDTNYKGRFGIDCGPCDGLDGIATSDADIDYQQTECHVVAMPSDVKHEDQVPARFPEMFSVEVLGSSDHFGGRNQTSPRLYSLSHGRMYGDVRANSSLWLWRHDTYYTTIYQNGKPMPLHNAHTSQIHAQTLKQRDEDGTGPQVHLASGMPDWMVEGCSCTLGECAAID
jgi:hypothetical protein